MAGAQAAIMDICDRDHGRQNARCVRSSLIPKPPASTPETGDRIVEIGAVELMNHLPTGRTYHQYINPERPMPKEAFDVHGLGDDFLRDKPKFAQIVQDFVDFIGDDAKLVIHNAQFDMKFLNAELKWAGTAVMPYSRAVDTLEIARNKFPGAQNSLDALCRRFRIDNSNRTLHGALLDSELLAEVYLALRGRPPAGLVLDVAQGRRTGIRAGAPGATPAAASRAPAPTPDRRWLNAARTPWRENGRQGGMASLQNIRTPDDAAGPRGSERSGMTEAGRLIGDVAVHPWRSLTGWTRSTSARSPPGSPLRHVRGVSRSGGAVCAVGLWYDPALIEEYIHATDGIHPADARADHLMARSMR